MEWLDALNQVRNGIEDLATLEVITLTGEATSILQDGKVMWGGLLESAESSEGRIELVASTKMAIDSDVLQFVSDRAGDMPALLRLHEGAVKVSMENRRAIIDFIRTVLGVIP